MTQMAKAKAGRITEQMEAVSKAENIDPALLMERIASGKVVIPLNINHNLERPVGVGYGLRTKVNANVGTSTDYNDLSYEIEKAKVAVRAGADAVMDLSTEGDLSEIRKRIIEEIPAVIGTVPIYEAAVQAVRKRGGLVKMTEEDMFAVLERQAEQGVDFFTIHSGVTRSSIERLQKQKRLTDIVSRGGSMLTTWMIANDCENPFFASFDRVLEIAKAYDITLSLGDGLRPGSLNDASDRAQIQELIILGELTKRAWEQDVQVIIEGPGHVPLHQIRMNIELQKQLCNEAPFYVLGPIVTDVAPGYDHITSAIGGAIAAWSGADFLCYVTPGEHLKLPSLQDVHKGVIATRIAGHAADIAKGIYQAIEWDNQISKARHDLDWEKQIQLAIDPDHARQLRGEKSTDQPDVCSMCGDYCAIKMVHDVLNKDE